MTHKLLKLLQQQCEPMRSAELQHRLKRSQSEISRQLQAAMQAGMVVKIGRGKLTRYLATQDRYSLGTQIPLYQIDPQGQAQHIATWNPTCNGGGVMSPIAKVPWPWLQGENRNGYFAGLPYFLDDLRPQGFLGRCEAHRLAHTFDYPRDLRQWSSNHIERYLLQYGHDLPGHLVLGETAYQHIRQQPSPTPITLVDYPECARMVLEGKPIGSSAGGEQPKFTAFTAQGHVIVKFCSVDSVRYRDLLLAEHLANQLLPQLGLETAKTAFQQVEEYCFLTSYRFDRHGERGRSALFSLAAIDAEFIGIGTTWVKIAADLQQQGYLHPETAQKIQKAHLFGRYIANTDMHLGNLSLRPTDYGFTLAPLYDMTPMAFATPTVTTLPQSMHNQVLESKWLTEQESKQVHELAHTFWQCLAENELISEDFKGICQQVLLHVFS